MSLKWSKDKNPYIHNAFGVLQLGPFAKPNEIVPQEKKLRTKLKRGSEPIELAGVPLEEHDLGEASKQLRDPHTLAEALLLVHPQQRVNQRRRKTLSQEIRALNDAQSFALPLKFKHLGGLCWFAPGIGHELGAPQWPDLSKNITPRGDLDLALDIEFDR